VIEDGVVAQDSFDVVDDIDLRDWLLAHGALRETVECALIRGVVYDLGFAYEGGDPRRPACGAGTALRGLLRAFFTFRGSLMWRLNAGMGDVVFLPFYELLVKRGVDVRFFHRVEQLRVRDGGIAEIEIDVQAQVPPETPATTFATPAAPDLAREELAWPSDPRLVLPREALGPNGAVDGATYESWYAARAATQVETTVLGRGAPDGFDLVVFGLPISCVPLVAPDLIAHSPGWERAVDYIRTVPTQAMQLWLDVDPFATDGLRGIVASGFVEPFDSWADMSHLVGRERVRDSRAVAYFCNVMPDAPPPERGHERDWLAAQHALVRFQAERFLNRDLGDLWPQVVHPVTSRFDWDRLVDPSGGHGPRRLDSQYLRANVEPSERYVLSVPGSSRHRIHPADTGFDNLYAAGDWTLCGLNAGCVEGAVISGMVAANAIHRAHGDPAQAEAIIGFERLSKGDGDGG
jgi:uncharacterized protein with NAD-binding domain and iron-sulfur cluster